MRGRAVQYPDIALLILATGWNYLWRGRFWCLCPICYLRSVGPGVLCGEPPSREEFSRDGANYQGR